MTLEQRISEIERRQEELASLLGLPKHPVKSKRAHKRRVERDQIKRSILVSR
jgi:hypothetical protein